MIGSIWKNIKVIGHKIFNTPNPGTLHRIRDLALEFEHRLRRREGSRGATPTPSPRMSRLLKMGKTLAEIPSACLKAQRQTRSEVSRGYWQYGYKMSRGVSLEWRRERAKTTLTS